jgi:TetR/AcrR family tetracycline transcriptional repressor
MKESGMQLRRNDVLRGAIELLDSEGLDALTMRKLGAHLGVQQGGLYWHFKNKLALLEAIAGTLVEGVGDDLPPAPWDEQLDILAHRLRAALLAHRDGARVMAGTYTTDQNTVAIAKVGIDALSRAGFDRSEAAVALTIIGHYVLGHTIEEQALSGVNGPEHQRPERPNGDANDLDRLFHDTFASDPATRFAYGIRTIINGLQVQISPQARNPIAGLRREVR